MTGWVGGASWPAALVLVGTVPLLAMFYGPVAQRAAAWAMHGTIRAGHLRPRQLSGPTAECAAHLAAAALLTVAALATGTLLPRFGTAVTRDHNHPELALAATAVGAAEVGLATLAASVVLAVVAMTPFAGHEAPGRPALAGPTTGWLSLPRSGWARRWPRPGWRTPAAATGSALLLVGVAAEEAVFRGLMITLLRPFGAVAAVCIATAAYVAYGLTRPAAGGSAIEAACCCLVLGAVNGGLFAAVPALLPLIAAHLAFVLILG